MRQGKKQSIHALIGAMTEAESKSYCDESEPILNDLKSLLKRFLIKDKTPERECIRIDFEAGLPLTGKGSIRQRLGAIDMEFFGRAYFPHYFSRPSPSFHRELDAIWKDGVLKERLLVSQAAIREISHMHGVKRAIAAPRGHAKSTNLTFKGTMHSIVYEYKHYPIIISDSSDQAESFLENIRVEFEENEALREDFGDLTGKVWRSNVLITSTNIKVEAIGSGKKIRGRKHRNWRPDLLVLDDVENDENVNTPEQRKKLAAWFNKAVSNAGDTYTDIVYIGTLLHYDSLLAKVMKNPEYKSVKYRGVISFADDHSLWNAWELIYNDLDNEDRERDARDFFESNQEEMLAGTKVLWEEKLSYYDLMVKRISLGDAAFNSEIQNDPIDPESCTFQEEWFDFYDGKEPDFTEPRFIFFAANDPSLGKNKKSDTSAIIVLAKDTKSGYLYVLIASVEKRTPDVIITDAIEISKRLKIDYQKGMHRFGIETVQFQYFFKDVMAQRSVEAGEYLPIEEIQSLQNKDVRIQSLQPMVKNGYIKFSQKHKTLLQQMKEYPMGRNDDAPDTLQMAVKLALTYKGGSKVDYKSVIPRILKFKSGSY